MMVFVMEDSGRLLVRVEMVRYDEAWTLPFQRPVTRTAISSLEKLLGGPRDNALLRYSLGGEWLKAGDAARAADYLRGAVEKDPAYSAAWKLLGRALAEAGRPQEALAAYRQGMAVAQKKGDKQAEREMAVFARRLEKALGNP
jgi:Flp pilus assembly protein TadD